ncbi:MAG TPA: DUF4350 domain-containing protein [Phenylobacterium sp.]|nr:DUF4350 domain-containing protein [Phenylobacterium sp.]
MSLQPEPRPSAAPFSPRTILALVLIGVTAFAGLSVLAVYAPDLRGGMDGGAHALSPSAVGFRGATIMLKALDAPVVISRAPAASHAFRGADLLVLTPPPGTEAKQLTAFPKPPHTLIVLPKWQTIPDADRPPYVRKYAVLPDRGWTVKMLGVYGPTLGVSRRAGVSKPILRGAGAPFMAGTYLPLGRIDQLQTIRGDGWAPALVDETGAMVLAYSKARPDVLVLADPDLLNNQGLAQIDTARAGMAVVQALQGDGVMFDVTLAGFTRGRSIGKLMLEPPWLAATLCAVAAAILMGLHALARFGPVRERGRAIALGAGALVDNSAGLVRMARKEAALAPQYVELAKVLVTRAAGGGRAGTEADHETWLAELARRRGLDAPEDLTAEATRARTRDEVAALGAKLYRWRREMTREGR